jgi:hypothetical protein
MAMNMRLACLRKGLTLYFGVLVTKERLTPIDSLRTGDRHSSARCRLSPIERLLRISLEQRLDTGHGWRGSLAKEIGRDTVKPTGLCVLMFLESFL